MVHGILAGQSVSFPLPQPNACKTGVNCPVKSNDRSIYINSLPVSKIYPKVSNHLKKGSLVCCYVLSNGHKVEQALSATDQTTSIKILMPAEQ